MLEAYLLTYSVTNLLHGTEYGDVERSQLKKAVYVPSEKLLVRTGQHDYIGNGPLYQMYEVLTGKSAETGYRKLLLELKKVRKIKPKKIKVGPSFVEWAKALKSAQNPPKEISDLLSVR